MIDLAIGNEGPVYFLRPLTERGRAWLAARVPAALWREDAAFFAHDVFQAALLAAFDAGLEADSVPTRRPHTDAARDTSGCEVRWPAGIY